MIKNIRSFIFFCGCVVIAVRATGDVPEAGAKEIAAAASRQPFPAPPQTLGQFDYPDGRRKALISDIRSASAAERRVLLDLSVSCEWSTDPNVYSSPDDFDAVVPECQKMLKLYKIEFLQQDPESTSGWRKPKREIDRQIYNENRLEQRALLSTSIMESAHRAKQFVDAHEMFTFLQREVDRVDYDNTKKIAIRDLDALNRFYDALGDCLRDAREGELK